jgi:hypothetical protein
MKNKRISILLLLTFATIMWTQSAMADSDGTVAPRKYKSVAVNFSDAQAKARRPLTRSERLRRDANLRSQKRLQADYNQTIPF